MCTGPSSTMEQISDFEVVEGEGRQQEDRSTALLSPTIKGIEVTIQWWCSSCQYKQREFVEKSNMHRCKGCRL